MKKRFLTVPLNDMVKTEYDCGIEKSDNLFITELPEKEFLILLEKFDEINIRCKILIDDYESEEISDNNLFDTKLIIDDIKESIPVFYHALEKAITYDTLLGLDF